MSLSRRLAAGLPTVGATVLVALALGGAPAAATPDLTVKAAHAVLTPSPGADDQRGIPGYGGTAQEVPGTPTTVSPATGTAPATTPPVATTPPAVTPTRGQPTYGPSATPSSTPSTPSGTAGSVPPAGVNSETATPAPSRTTSGAGVSSGGTLPLTGAPVGGTVAFGGMLLGLGVMAVWYTRSRRTV